MIKLFCDSCNVEMLNPVVGAVADDRNLCVGAIVTKPHGVSWLMSLTEVDGKPFFAHVCSPDCAVAWDREHGIKTRGMSIED